MSVVGCVCVFVCLFVGDDNAASCVLSHMHVSKLGRAVVDFVGVINCVPPGDLSFHLYIPKHKRSLWYVHSHLMLSHC
jgi:hypothetical protein